MWFILFKRVWRQLGEEYKDKYVLSTVKHGDGSVMVWHCISKELQFIKGTMNANMYCDILKQSMIPSLRRPGHRAVFQHDNPKHTSKTTTALLMKLRGKVDGLARQCWKIKMWGVYSLLWDTVYIYIVEMTEQYIVSIFVTLDHKTSLKCQFFEIEIYRTSQSWTNMLSNDVWFVFGWDTIYNIWLRYNYLKIWNLRCKKI